MQKHWRIPKSTISTKFRLTEFIKYKTIIEAGELLMMKQQTTEWILGYLFAHQERKLVKYLNNPTKGIQFTCAVPTLWFGIGANPRTESLLSIVDNLNTISTKLDKTLHDCLPGINTETTWTRNKQYIEFVTTIVIRQKLTVEDIEDLLGFRIEIISNK